MDIADRLRRLLGPDAEGSADHEGASGAALRVRAGGRTYWAKHGPTVPGEHDRLRWLSTRVRVPDIVAFDPPVLVLADVDAPSLFSASPADLGAVFGRTLRALHRLPVATCPFDGRLDTVLARAEANVRAGLVDQDDFDDDHRDLSPDDVLKRLRNTRPTGEDLVVAHGDYTTTNVLDPAQPVVIDVPALGVADRYRDLAIAHRELPDDAWQNFLSAYGLVDTVDAEKLYYYRLLDEVL